MKILMAGLVASTFALGACQQQAASNDAVANDFGSSESSSTNGDADLTNTGATAVDAAFVTEAMKGDNGEVAIGNLAASQAASAAAKDFGRMLATDHGAHKQKLAAMAASAGIEVTDEPAEEAKTNLEKLKAMKGTAFDREFKRMMVEDHAKDIAKYEKQASSGDPETSALAKDTLPTLRKHLATAQSL